MARKLLMVWAALMGTLFVSTTAYAGPYSDDLSKCLVGAATEKDKLQLIEWIFFNISLNPNISPYTNITPRQRETVNQNLARIFERLLAESCPAQTKLALKYEGEESFARSFGSLGETAASYIFNHPAVIAGTSNFTQYLDVEKMRVLFAGSSEMK